MSHRSIRTLLLLAASCVALLAFAPGAMARGHRGDRNGDRIPDRWEKAHHLSLKVNQARRDQDHDGLRNRAEFRAGDDPRDADTDNDGIKDGQEKAGTVTSFADGVLTIHLFNGDDVKGTVDDNTELKCEDAPAMAPAARAADDGGGDNSGPGENSGPGGGDRGDDDQGDDNDDQGDDDHGDDEGEDHQQADCTTANLTPGAVIGEAELKATAAGLVFREVEIVG